MVNKRLMAIIGAGMMMAPTVFEITPTIETITTPTQPMLADSHEITARYTGQRRLFSRPGRRIGGGAYIVRNQRQKRKCWRQSPHKRPVSNIH